MICIMSTAAEDDIEKLVVTDLINQLDIADGLKGLLISSDFTLKSLQNTSASDFAKILGIDEYVAKLLTDAIKLYDILGKDSDDLEVVHITKSEKHFYMFST